MRRYAGTRKSTVRKSRPVSVSVANGNNFENKQLQASYGSGNINSSAINSTSQSTATNSQCTSTSERMGKFGPLAKICFPTESDELDSNDRSRLKNFGYGLALLANQREISVDVTGFTDSRGNADYNKSLSERRAYSVASYLSTVIPSTANKINLTYHGDGEIGPDTPGLTGDQLNDYRIVMANVHGYDGRLPVDAACQNIKRWLASGVFHEAWGNGKVEYGNTLIKMLEIVAKEPGIVPGSYNDYLLDDLLILTDHKKNFDKSWNQKTYEEHGGLFKGCSFWNPDPAVHDYAMRARKFLTNSKQYHCNWRDIVCKRASYWGKSDGTPKLESARKIMVYLLEHKILPVRQEARRRAMVIDHPCEMMEDILIINDIIADLQNFEGSIYHAILDI